MHDCLKCRIKSIMSQHSQLISKTDNPFRKFLRRYSTLICMHLNIWWHVGSFISNCLPPPFPNYITVQRWVAVTPAREARDRRTKHLGVRRIRAQKRSSHRNFLDDPVVKKLQRFQCRGTKGSWDIHENTKQKHDRSWQEASREYTWVCIQQENSNLSPTTSQFVVIPGSGS